MTVARQGLGAVPWWAWALLVLGCSGAGGRAAEEGGIEPGLVRAVEFEGEFDVDMEPYGRQLLEIVKRTWQVPESAKRGRKGAAALRFEITAAGDVQRLVVLRERGRDALTRAAVAAIRDSSPFPPPPPEAVERVPVGVTWSFTYNLEPDERARFAKKVERARERRDDGR